MHLMKRFIRLEKKGACLCKKEVSVACKIMTMAYGCVARFSSVSRRQSISVEFYG